MVTSARLKELWTDPKYRQRMSDSHKGKMLGNKNGFKKGQTAWNKGIERYWDSPTEFKTDTRNSKWKGTDNEYNQIHRWIVKQKGLPDICENCKVSGFKGKNIQWASKEHKYLKEINEWLRLCSKCHFKYDKNSFKL